MNPPENSVRLYYVQWIRVLLTVLVVAHHAAEPYVAVGGGGWGDIVNDPARSATLQTLFVLNRTFFMGFFFLISGYFLDSSLKRHGSWGVVRSRLIKLGIPLVVIVVFVFGSIGYAVYGEGQGYFTFIFRDYLGTGNAEFGHLWFIAHLLVYILIYVLLRAVFPFIGRFAESSDPPGNLTIFIYVLIVGAVLAVTRAFWPIDTWVRFLGLVPGELAHMPFYISLFAIGVVAGRTNWFERLDAKVALPWFVAGMIVFVAMTVLVGSSRLAQPDTTALRIAWSFLEPLVGVGIMLGLIFLFRTHLSGPSAFLFWIGGSLYGIYLLHLFVVIGLQMALLGTSWPAMAKFLLVLVGTLVICFPIVLLLRTIPGFKKVL